MAKHLVLILLLACSDARSSFESGPRGARAAGMAGAMVSVEGDLWAPFSNPSCLYTIKGTNITAAYVPGIFGMWEVKETAVSLSRSTSLGTLALSLSAFGFALYREFSVALAAARELNERIVLGVNLNFYSLKIDGYGSGQAAGVDIGALVHIAQDVSYGVALRNVNRPAIGDEPLPQSMAMGISVCPFPAARIAVGAQKDSRYPFELSVGVEYCIEDLLTLRFGASHEPSIIAAGIGIRTSLLRMDYAYTMHSDLGGTHCISVSFAVP
jgi:hypothetical protein